MNTEGNLRVTMRVLPPGQSLHASHSSACSVPLVEFPDEFDDALPGAFDLSIGR